MFRPETYDWSRFEIVFYYDVPIERVFRAVSTAGGLASFFIEKATFRDAEDNARADDEPARVGDRYRWDWRQPFSVEGEVTEVIPNRKVAYTFGDMRFSISLSEVDGTTELHLVQTDIPDTPDGLVMEHLNCRSCWTFFFTNLKSVLEEGVDLRDARPDCVSSMEVGFVPRSG